MGKRLTEEERRQRKKNTFLKFLKEGMGIVSYACDKTNISRQTFYNWKDNDDDFAQQAEDIQETTVDMAESKLLTSINEGNVAAIIFYLKTKGKKRGYVEQHDVDVNGNAFEKLMRETIDDDEDE
ncbi:MAG: phBC6A51 family helix-turn-helix protein [Prevotella sp.]